MCFKLSNISLQVWSNELAQLAAVNACACNYQHANLPPIPYRNHFARENHIVYAANDLGIMVAYWYLEYELYDYANRQCNTSDYGVCEHYLNVSIFT